MAPHRTAMPSAIPARLEAKAGAAQAPSLIADIGGTHARFALEMNGLLSHIVAVPVANYARFQDAVKAYLYQQTEIVVKHAAIAIANPVDGDYVQMTNTDWHFSISDCRDELALDTLLVVNDFTALAMALPRLQAHDTLQIGAGVARSRAVVGLVGAGTGLGVSGLLPLEERWIALGSEGGHVSFSPVDIGDQQLLDFARARATLQAKRAPQPVQDETAHPHISAERFLSGRGLQMIYAAKLKLKPSEPDPLSAAAITALSREGDSIALATVDTFLGILGSFAGNVALTFGALGGVYIGAGIAPRLAWRIAQSPFRQRFEAKGRFSRYCAAIPTFLITAEAATFLGAQLILREALNQASPTDLIGQVRSRRPAMAQAARRVADALLADPQAFAQLPTSELAVRATVSDPTIMRFCRSFGFDGIPEFKRALAAALNGTLPIRHSTVTRDDSAHQIALKVIDNTNAATVQLRQQLDPAAISAALQIIRQAKRLRLFGVGLSGVVCLDAQARFVRLGVDAQAVVDANQIEECLPLIDANNLIIIVSNSGQNITLLKATQAARVAGAKVLAITNPNSQLAKASDVVLAIEQSEINDNHISMITRVLQLLLLDILTVGRETAIEPVTDKMLSAPDITVATAAVATAPRSPKNGLSQPNKRR